MMHGCVRSQAVGSCTVSSEVRLLECTLLNPSSQAQRAAGQQAVEDLHRYFDSLHRKLTAAQVRLVGYPSVASSV